MRHFVEQVAGERKFSLFDQAGNLLEGGGRRRHRRNRGRGGGGAPRVWFAISRRRCRYMGEEAFGQGSEREKRGRERESRCWEPQRYSTSMDQ